MTLSPATPFQWIPGRGYDPAALRRLVQASPRPVRPMGEAWFNTDKRRMYPELLGDLAAVPVRELEYILAQIANGTSSFGPYDEWSDWFHYLLPRLLPRSHETYVEPLLEILITALFTQYPAGLGDARYPGFREDVLATVGQC